MPLEVSRSDHALHLRFLGRIEAGAESLDRWTQWSAQVEAAARSNGQRAYVDLRGVTDLDVDGLNRLLELVRSVRNFCELTYLGPGLGLSALARQVDVAPLSPMLTRAPWEEDPGEEEPGVTSEAVPAANVEGDIRVWLHPEEERSAQSPGVAFEAEHQEFEALEGGAADSKNPVPDPYSTKIASARPSRRLQRDRRSGWRQRERQRNAELGLEVLIESLGQLETESRKWQRRYEELLNQPRASEEDDIEQRAVRWWRGFFDWFQSDRKLDSHLKLWADQAEEFATWLASGSASVWRAMDMAVATAGDSPESTSEELGIKAIALAFVVVTLAREEGPDRSARLAQLAARTFGEAAGAVESRSSGVGSDVALWRAASALARELTVGAPIAPFRSDWFSAVRELECRASIDPELVPGVRRLLCAVSAGWPGCWVELSDGSVGVIVEAHAAENRAQSSSSPQILVLFGRAHGRLTPQAPPRWLPLEGEPHIVRPVETPHVLADQPAATRSESVPS